MREGSKCIFLWAVGGSIYYSLEQCYRGFSHWSMFVLGGICFVFAYVQGKSSSFQEPLVFQILRCMIFVTATEFITGIIVNKWMYLGVWDYSRLPFQVFGQICVPFMILFSGLSAVGIFLSAYLVHWIYGEKKPEFHVL